MGQLGEVEAHGRWRDPGRFGQRAGRQPVWSRLDQQAEHREPMLLRQGTEGPDDCICLHATLQ